MIGCCDVPCAFILAPLAINKQVAFAPVPELPLIIVPGSIVNVAPLDTVVLPTKTHILSFVSVRSFVILNGKEFSNSS